MNMNRPVRLFSLPCLDDSTNASNMAYRPPLGSMPMDQRRGFRTTHLFERISEAESLRAQQSPTIVSRLQSAGAAREALRRLLEERESIEREITLGSNNARHY